LLKGLGGENDNLDNGDGDDLDAPLFGACSEEDDF